MGYGFSLPGRTNWGRLSSFLQSCALMQLPPKRVEVAVKPERVVPADFDREVRKKEYNAKKQKWWRCPNPGCTAAVKNKHSQRKGNTFKLASQYHSVIKYYFLKKEFAI